MSNEKRMADHYEIISAFRIGDKEVVFGQDKNCDKPYFCALYEKEVVLCYTRERYEDCYTGDDYIAMMELYADRIKGQLLVRHPKRMLYVKYPPPVILLFFSAAERAVTAAAVQQVHRNHTQRNLSIPAVPRYRRVMRLRKESCKDL